MSQINIDEIISQVHSELVLRSEQDRLRAEGIVLLSQRIREEVQKQEEASKQAETSKQAEEVQKNESGV